MAPKRGFVVGRKKEPDPAGVFPAETGQKGRKINEQERQGKGIPRKRFYRGV